MTMDNAARMAAPVILATCLAFAAGCQKEDAPRNSVASAAKWKHGGTKLVYQVDPQGTSATTDDVIRVLGKRLDKAGLKNVWLTPLAGGGRLELFTATTDLDEVSAIKRWLLKEGKLEFRICARPASVPNYEEIAARHARGEPTPEGFQWLPLFDESNASWEKQREFLFYGREDMTPAKALARHMADSVVYVMRELKASDEQTPSGPAANSKVSVEILVLANLPAVTHQDFARVRKEMDPMSGDPTIGVTIKEDVRAQQAMATLTGKHIGWRMAIVLDGRIQSAPSIRDKLRDSGILTGYKSVKERDAVLAVLQSGALDANLELLSQSTIPPDSP